MLLLHSQHQTAAPGQSQFAIHVLQDLRGELKCLLHVSLFLPLGVRKLQAMNFLHNTEM